MSSDPHGDLLSKLNSLLTTALQKTSQQITDRLLKEIREVGTRTAALELSVEDIFTRIDTLSRDIDHLKEENLVLHARIEDAENRSRSYNFHIRGLPESIQDAHSTALALFRELAPDIPVK